MCVTYMRQLAQKKTNALMSKMPSAAVIVDNQLRIIDANKKFQAMFDHDFRRTDRNWTRWRG